MEILGHLELRGRRIWAGHGDLAPDPVDAEGAHGPTLVRAAGGAVPDGVDGVDLAALAKGETEARRYLDALSGGPADDPRASIGITDGRWKYIWWPEGGQEQLFDLENDRYETVNLAPRSELRSKCDELRLALVERHRALSYGYVRDGDLVSLPVQEDAVEGKRKLYDLASGNCTECSFTQPCLPLLARYLTWTSVPSHRQRSYPFCTGLPHNVPRSTSAAIRSDSSASGSRFEAGLSTASSNCLRALR